MEKKLRKVLSVLLIAVILVIGTAIPAMLLMSDDSEAAFFETANDGERVVMVRLDTDQNLRELVQYGEIIDHYGQNVLLRTTSRGVEELHTQYDIQRLHNRNELSIKGNTFDTSRGVPEFNSELIIDEYEPGTEGLYIVDMIGPVNPEWRAEIEKTGADVINYQPNYAYEVVMTPEQADNIEDFEFVEWVGVYQPEFKLHNQLGEALELDMPVNVRLTPGFEETTLNSINSELNVLGVEDLQDNGYRLTITARSIEELEELATDPDVYHISPYVEPELYAEMDIQLIGGGQWFMDDEYPTNDDLTPPPRQGDPQEPYRLHGDYGAYLNQLGYSGEGITISTADTGIGDGEAGDAGVEDFTDRVIGGYGFGQEDQWQDGHYHGTACTGLIAGDTHRGTGDTWDEFQDGDMPYYMGQGLAYESEIFATKIFDDGGGFIPSEYYPIVEEPAQRSDTYIHSNSWGAGTMGEYVDTDEIFDQAVRDADRDDDENVPMVITVSAGNDGGRGDYSQETGSPGNAKNVITVGGNQPYNPGLGYNNPENMYGASSRGWTEDNRVKPDVIAPSESVISQNTPLDGGGYVSASGTSFGNPLVAGAATIVVDWYEQNYEETPSPAMVKSILINTANELDPEVGDSSGHVPNRDEGWGVPDISKLEYPLDDPLGFQFEDQESLLTTGEVDEYDFNYQDEDEPLKITLTWTDKNALDGDSSGGTPTLKNNLDLEVETPGGEIIRGNAFDLSGDGDSDDGFTYPDAEVMADFDYNDDGWDDVNNVQNVFIHPDELEAGSYTVRVLGTNIPEDANNDGEANQDYALTTYNTPSDLHIDIPDKDGEIMIEKNEYAGNDVANITLNDIILEGEEVYDINVSSTDADGNELDNITVELIESEEEYGLFKGQVQLTDEENGDGLYVEHDGEITAWYLDEDPGLPEDDEELDDQTFGTSGQRLYTETKIAVVDETNYFEGEIANHLEEYLPGDYTVDTLEADELIDEMETYDGFVPWRFGSDALAEDFLDELDDQQGVVYLDSYEGFTSEGYGDAVTRLHNVRGDPGEHWSGSGTSSPVELVIEQEHDIFQDLGEEGDTVLLFESGTIWGSWYDDYSGEDLALVQYDGENEGQGVGIDDDDNEIILPAKSIDFFAEPEDWTAESWTLLANSVDFISGRLGDDIGVTEILSPEHRVNSDNSHPVEVNVHNFGENDQMYVPVETTITNIETGGTEYQDDTIIHIAEGEDVTAVFDDWTPSETGEYFMNSTTLLEDDENPENDYTTMEILVENVHDVGVNEIISPVEETSILETEVEAEIENYGTYHEEFDVHATIEDMETDEEVYTETITAELGILETKSVSFPDWEPGVEGDYLVEITTDLEDDEYPDNDYATEEVEVYSYNDIIVDEITSPEEYTWEEEQPVTATIINDGHYDVVEIPIEAEIRMGDELLYEEFEEEIPDDWTIEGEGEEPETWHWDETFGGEPMATVDVTRDFVQEEWLITPVIDASEAEGTTMEIDHTISGSFSDPQFTAELLITNDGEEWNLVEEWNEEDDDDGVQQFDLSEHADGEEEIQIAFVWHSDNDEDMGTWCNWDIFEVDIFYFVTEYEDEVLVDLETGETLTAEFDNWMPSEPSEFEIEVTADYPEDDYPETATIVRPVNVEEILIDVEATSIDEPSEPIFQYEEEVHGTVTNLGNREIIDTPVEMIIEPVLEDIPIDEDFSGGLPGDWTVDDKDENDNTWVWNEDTEMMEIIPIDDHEHDVLWTEIADSTLGEHRVMLEFYSEFEGENERSLLISTDGGETSRRIGSNISEGQITYDVTQWASGEEEVMIGWEFYTGEAEEDLWTINDVTITNEYLDEEYQSEQIIDYLDPGESTQLQFEDWTPENYPSDYIMKMETLHGEDVNIENTEIQERVHVGEHFTPNAVNPYPEDGELDVNHTPILNATVEVHEDLSAEATIYIYDEDGNEIGNHTQTGIKSGGFVEAAFPLLETNTTFEWYVEVDDGLETGTSETWTFITYTPEPEWKSDSADINILPPEQVENLTLDWDDDVWDVTGNKLTWDASSDDGAGADDTDRYVIYRAEDETGPWDDTTMIDIVTADGSEEYIYVDEDMANDGTQWNYVVRAVDRVDNMEMNEDSVSELPVPYADNPEPEAGAEVIDLEQALSVDIFTQNEEGLHVEFYDGATHELIDEFTGVTEDTRLEVIREFETEDRAQDHYWYVVVSYEDYNIGSINPEQYTLEVNTVGDGTVEIEPEEDYYLEYTEIELEAIPEEDWEFVNWTGDYESTDDEITIIMDSDKEITANFEYDGDLVGEWRWLYEGEHRPDTADNALAAANPQVWYGSVILDLSDDVGGYITEVAYFDYDAAANYVQAHVAEDDGGAPGEWISSSDEYTPVGGETWAELELDEPVEIEEPGNYWIVLEIDDPAGDNEFTFGTIDPDVNDGGWINFGDPHNPGDWDTLPDLLVYSAWGLEAHVEVPGSPDQSEDELTEEQLMGSEINVAVVDEENWQENEIEYKLEEYLDDEYNVDTLEADELLDEMENYDSFVIQRFGSDSLAEDFLEEKDDGQGVVYLDTNQGGTAEAYSDGVYRLNNVRNDPGFRDEESLGTNPPQYLEILEDHPIFEDVGEAGDNVLMFDGTTNWGSIFDDYSGEILAEKDYGDGFEGPAVGVNDDLNEVLLPAKGIGFFGEADDTGWTGEANQMFANAVIHVSDPVLDDMGWDFHLSSLEPIADAGEDIDAWRDVTVTLDASASSHELDEGIIEHYNWTIEDPMDEVTELYGMEVDYTPEYIGSYEVTLETVDQWGTESWDSIELYANPHITKFEAQVGMNTASIEFGYGLTDVDGDAITEDDLTFEYGDTDLEIVDISHEAYHNLIAVEFDKTVTEDDLGEIEVKPVDGEVRDEEGTLKTGILSSEIADTGDAITLTEGWNMISLPRNPHEDWCLTENASFEDLINMHAWDIESQQWADPVDLIDAGEFDTFTAMLVDVERPTEIELWLEEQDPTSVPPTTTLQEGWNLVGTNMDTTVETDVTIESFLASVDGSWSTINSPGYNLGTWTYTHVDPEISDVTVNAYQGYWVYMNEDATLAGRTI